MPLRLAHAAFKPADIFACTSGVRKALTLFCLISGSVFNILCCSRIGFDGSKKRSLRNCFSFSEWIDFPIFLAICFSL